jgi:hypothetical protein
MEHVLFGSYPGALAWAVNGDIGDPAEYARELAFTANCAFYTVDGIEYGPFEVAE